MIREVTPKLVKEFTEVLKELSLTMVEYNMNNLETGYIFDAIVERAELKICALLGYDLDLVSALSLADWALLDWKHDPETAIWYAKGLLTVKKNLEN